MTHFKGEQKSIRGEERRKVNFATYAILKRIEAKLDKLLGGRECEKNPDKINSEGIFVRGSGFIKKH